MDNNQVVERRRTAQASRSPMEVLEELPALVLLERIPVPTLAVLQDGTIVFANTAFAEILGRAADEVVALMSRSAMRRADDAIALATFQDLTEELWANER